LRNQQQKRSTGRFRASTTILHGDMLRFFRRENFAVSGADRFSPSDREARNITSHYLWHLVARKRFHRPFSMSTMHAYFATHFERTQLPLSTIFAIYFLLTYIRENQVRSKKNQARDVPLVYRFDLSNYHHAQRDETLPQGDEVC